jgi:hypothetical protein
MGGIRLSTATWKWLICALTLLSAVLVISEARHAVRALLFESRQGTLGATLDDHIGLHPQSQGTHRLTIIDLAAGGPLAAAGARQGDQLRYDRTVDRWRRFQPGEAIGLTLLQGGAARHLRLAAVATPIPFFEAADFTARMLMVVPAILFSLLIGVKQGDSSALRALAMSFCALTLIAFISINYSPAGMVLHGAKVAQLVSYPLVWYWCARFALHYPSGHDGAIRRRLRRLFPAFRVAAFGVAAYAGWFGLGNEAPLLLALEGAIIVAGVAFALLSVYEGWRDAGGEARQRHQWLLLSFTVGTVPAMVAWIPAFDAGYHGMRYTIMVMFVSQLVMYAGLAYAVLRHRVFNFDFAISRMLIFSVVSILLLCTFGVLERISSSLLHGGPSHVPPLTLFIDGVIALAVYLVFHHLHGRVERKVERIFFHQWHENEHALRRYVRQAQHVTSVDALLASLCRAIDCFTAHAGCAIYLRQGDGSYHLCDGATLAQAPQRIDADHGMAVALRSDLHVQQIERAGALPAELMLPMSHRGALNGFLLVGARRSGEAYRPDECEVLGFAAQQVGLDLHALKVELLETQMQALAQQVARQDSELALMAGRRRTPVALRELFAE